jgi:hypothetical protein
MEALPHCRFVQTNEQGRAKAQFCLGVLAIARVAVGNATPSQQGEPANSKAVKPRQLQSMQLCGDYCATRGKRSSCPKSIPDPTSKIWNNAYGNAGREDKSSSVLRASARLRSGAAVEILVRSTNSMSTSCQQQKDESGVLNQRDGRIEPRLRRRPRRAFDLRSMHNQRNAH